MTRMQRAFRVGRSGYDTRLGRPGRGPASPARGLDGARFRDARRDPLSTLRQYGFGLALAIAAAQAAAQPETLRKALSERLPQLPPVVGVERTPMPGVFEVLLQDGTLIYSDAAGNFILQGSLIDTRRRIDLTEQRHNQLTAVRFDQLPLQDAFVIQRGKGTRQVAVFEDPHCGFCKRFERDLARIDDVKVHVFLYPVLGPPSRAMARQIWCSRDRADTFLKWMLHDQPPPEAQCDDAALVRNLEFGRKARIHGTPTVIFADGTRVPGAIPANRIEELLRSSAGR